MTVPAVKDVLCLHFLHINTTDVRVAYRYGSTFSWHFGQVNPFGQRIASRYFSQAASFGKTFWNSGSVVGNPLGSIMKNIADYGQCLKKTDRQARYTCLYGAYRPLTLVYTKSPNLIGDRGGRGSALRADALHHNH